MEYLWRTPHDLARLEYVQDVPRRSSSLSPQHLNQSYRRLLLLSAVAVFLAQALALALLHSQQESRFPSNFLQFLLGVIAFLATLDAGRRSQQAARRIWYYAAAGIGAYTAGQMIFIGYDLLGLGAGYSPRISDQFFFFWVAPLLVASAMDSLGRRDGFDTAALLDLTQLLLLGIVLHVFVFGDAARWLSHTQQMEFLKLKARVLRDAIILGILWARAWLSSSRQLRNLFLRLGIFYLAYSAADAVYLYLEALWDLDPGTWLDLLWSVPRLLLVVLALTWRWEEDAERQQVAQPRRLRFFCHRMGPVVAPLALLAISFRAFPSAPILWASLMVGSFAIASIRMHVMQSRQERTLDDLHNSHELLHSIIEGTSEAIYLKDAEGRYKLINSAGARYIGRSPQEVLGKTDRELLSPETVGPILKIDQEVLSKGKSVTCEERLIVPDGTRTFLSTKNPYHDSEGRVTGVLGISVDITEHRRMEDQLRRIQRMDSIGTFSGAIAHDFSNLLTIIKGYSQHTQSEFRSNPSLQSNLEQIVKATNRAAELVRQLLAFSRQQQLQPRVISLNDILSHMYKMLQRLIGEDIEIVARFADDLWPVKADPGQIEQVLMNLAANARDAMPQGGKLILETHNVHLDEAYARSNLSVQPGDYAMLIISDNGVGMDSQTLSRVFEPFFTTKPTGKGTGLGLATAYGIIKQSGGYISVDSQPGAGATFRIYLPRVDQPIEYQIEAPSITQQNQEDAR